MTKYAFERWKPPAAPFETSDEMFVWQRYRCAACGLGAERRNGTPLQTDHDHETGLIRGYLCQRCNHAEGRQFEEWIRWRTGVTPACRYGLVEVYLTQYGRALPEFTVHDKADAAAIFRLAGLDYHSARIGAHLPDAGQHRDADLARVLALQSRVHAEREADYAEWRARWTN